MAWAWITKEFSFHAAHRLPNHDGKCRDLHGHTYKVQVSVQGPVKGATGESDEGMVLDFQVLKDIYKMEIEPVVEHKFLNESLAGDPDMQHTLSTPLTTAENLAVWLGKKFRTRLVEAFPDKDWRPRIVIRLWETPTSYAETSV